MRRLNFLIQLLERCCKLIVCLISDFVKYIKGVSLEKNRGAALVGEDNLVSSTGLMI